MIRKILAYHVVAILCCLLSPCSLSAETRQLAVSIGFPVNKTELLPGFGDNAAQLARMEDFLSNIDPETIDIIHVDGYPSPEGPYRHNLRLAEGRAQALIRYIAEHTAIPAEKLAVGESHLSWEALRPLVEDSEMKDADTVLALIDVALADQSEAAQLDAIGRLQRLNSGAAWREMKRKLFPQIRYSQLSVEIIDQPEPEPEPEPVIEPVIELIDTVAAPVTAAAEPEIESYTHLYLKTNGVGWAMLVSNFAVELDIAPHWSATLPVYYSGLNFFSHKVKFRTFTIQPEGRYWLRHDDEGNHGLFVGAHFGLGWYNYALNGKYRTQDHNGNTPAIGGGVAVGYRMRLAGRWSLEFSVGAGVYDARYDKYVNEQNGVRVVSDRHRTWLGIDQAAVSIVYAFHVKKGGGR